MFSERTLIHDVPAEQLKMKNQPIFKRVDKVDI